MMRSTWSKWLSGVGGVVLIGGLVLANYGGGVTPADAHYRSQNPFKQILSKLDTILNILNSPNTGGGGTPSPSPGGGAGNQTLRWDTNNTSARFTTAFTGAVLDNNTGLVWEQSPAIITPGLTWSDARIKCVDKNVGGTRGWRLPSVVELVSLIVPDPVSGMPVIPVEFTGVQSSTYWSATTNADQSGSTNVSKLIVSFDDGTVSSLAKGNTTYFWCVRGPMSESAY